MDRQGLYKHRPAPGTSKNERTRAFQTRGKANRIGEHLQNRGISDSFGETPVSSPVPTQEQPLIMKAVNKKATTMNFSSKVEERMFKVQEMRKQQIKNGTAKKSPFVSVVPCGRILPKKHDAVEDKMKEFRERRAQLTKSTTKRRSIRRKSIGKPQMVVKRQGNKAVVVKAPIIPRTKSVKKEPKSSTKPTPARRIPLIVEPQPGTSKATEHQNFTLKVKPRTPKAGTSKFIEPQNVTLKMKSRTPNTFLVPTTKTGPKTRAKEARQSFNICHSFITSTTSKRVSSAKIIPDEEEIDSEDTFLEGISPISDVTPFKFAPDEKSKRTSSSSNVSKGLPVPIMPQEEPMEEEIVQTEEQPFIFEARKTRSAEKETKEPTIDEELNITFTQEDEEEVEEGAMALEEEAAPNKSNRRSSMRKSLPVIPAPEVNERTPIAKAHVETLESEIKRLTDRNAIWTELRDQNDLNENVVGLINSAVGQSELLMRKKFPKFRELIENFENESGARAVLSDDLDGYWLTVTIEINSIDKRFTELETIRANNWEEIETEQKRPKARSKRTRKNVEKPENKTAVNLRLKEHIRKLREVYQKPEKLPQMNSEDKVQLMSVKRLADTPRQSIAKRRSLNCSGCISTPSSSRKSKSARKISTLVVSIVYSCSFMLSSYLTPSFTSKSIPKSLPNSKVQINLTYQPTPVSSHPMVLRNTRRVLFDISVNPRFYFDYNYLR